MARPGWDRPLAPAPAPAPAPAHELHGAAAPAAAAAPELPSAAELHAGEWESAEARADDAARRRRTVNAAQLELYRAQQHFDVAARRSDGVQARRLLVARDTIRGTIQSVVCSHLWTMQSILSKLV